MDIEKIKTDSYRAGLKRQMGVELNRAEKQIHEAYLLGGKDLARYAKVAREALAEAEALDAELKKFDASTPNGSGA